jgi:hypothetical protein
MERELLARHLGQSERLLAESEWHVRLWRDLVRRAKKEGRPADRQESNLALALSLLVLHAQRVDHLSKALGIGRTAGDASDIREQQHNDSVDNDGPDDPG